jgi:glycogen synthase
MKILVVSNLYPPAQLGGYELGCFHIVEELRLRGHDVHVLTSAVPDGAGIDGPHIERRLALRAFGLAEIGGQSAHTQLEFDSSVSQFVNTYAVLDAVERFRPDNVYLFNLIGLGGLAIIDALNLIGVSWTWHLMDRVPVQLLLGSSKSVAALYDAEEGHSFTKGTIFSISRNLLDEIGRDTGINLRDQAQIIPGWGGKRGAVMNRPYCPDGKVRFVAASALGPHKGIDLILVAARHLLDSAITNFSVDIYGFGDATTYINESRAQGLDSFVVFHGSRSQDQLHEIYERSDAFLFPTWEREPFGLSPLEAARDGCVPIMTSTCGAAETLVDRVHCMKIARDAESLSTAMASVCAGVVDLAGMGQRAQAITRQSLTLEACVDSVEAAFADSMSKPKVAFERHDVHAVAALASFKELVAINLTNDRRIDDGATRGR